MSEEKAIQKGRISSLDSVIKHKHPKLTNIQVRRARIRLLYYLSKGLSDGYDVALIKIVNDEEINLKVLKLDTEDK